MYCNHVHYLPVGSRLTKRKFKLVDEGQPLSMRVKLWAWFLLRKEIINLTSVFAHLEGLRMKR